MIKFEADPVVVGQRQREACTDGERNTPRINTVAPKSPQSLVSLLRFLRYLNALAVDPMRRSLTALIRASKSVPSLELVTPATCSLSSPLLPSVTPCPRSPFLFRDHPPVFISRTWDDHRSNQFYFSPTLLAGPDLANCIHRQSRSPSGRHRK
jgi:hypothetical protein